MRSRGQELASNMGEGQKMPKSIVKTCHIRSNRGNQGNLNVTLISERLSNKHASQFFIRFPWNGQLQNSYSPHDKVLWMISSLTNATGNKISEQPNCKPAAIHHGGAILRRFLGKISSCHPLWILNYDLLEKDKFQTHNENCIKLHVDRTWGLNASAVREACMPHQPSIRLSKPSSMFKAEKYCLFFFRGGQVFKTWDAGTVWAI